MKKLLFFYAFLFLPIFIFTKSEGIVKVEENISNTSTSKNSVCSKANLLNISKISISNLINEIEPDFLSTPCVRIVASDVSLHQISGSFHSVFLDAGPALQREPLQLQIFTLDYEIPHVKAFHKYVGTERNVEYLFRGKISSDKKKQNFTAIVELVDVPRNIIVKKQTASWSISKDPTTEIEAGKQLAQGFMPLNELLYDYEKIPLIGEINVPGDEVGSGDKVVISVAKLRYKDNLPKWWQFIAIKVEKGKILNGDFLEGYYYFQIGKNDIVEIDYLAPEGCKEEEEVFTVYNSCIFNYPNDRASQTKDQIIQRKFPIVCNDDEYKFVLNYDLKNYTGLRESYKLEGYFISSGYQKRQTGEMPFNFEKKTVLVLFPKDSLNISDANIDINEFTDCLSCRGKNPELDKKSEKDGEKIHQEIILLFDEKKERIISVGFDMYLGVSWILECNGNEECDYARIFNGERCLGLNLGIWNLFFASQSGKVFAYMFFLANENNSMEMISGSDIRVFGESDDPTTVSIHWELSKKVKNKN